jgi:hypothetical protein
VISYILFFFAGIGFGYAAGGVVKLAPLLFPLFLAIPALLRDDGDGEILARLLLALAITLGGILIGAMLDSRENRQAAQAG